MKHYKIITLAQDRQTFYAVFQNENGYYGIGFYNMFEFTIMGQFQFQSYNEAEQQLAENLF